MSDFNTTLTPGDNGAPSTATPAANPVAQPTTPAVPATPATPATPSEDRSNWVPPYRLREQNQRFEATLQAERERARTETEALNRKLQILAGVAPPENPQIDEVKNQFKSVFPELAELATQAEAIKALLAKREEFEATTQNYWDRHNRDAMDRLYKDAEATYGSALSEDAKRTLGSSFIGYLQSNPDAYERYQRDPSVASEFWKSFTDRFIDPVRRSAVVSTSQRIPSNLPQDTPSGAIAPSGNLEAPMTADERIARSLAVYKATSKTGFGT